MGTGIYLYLPADCGDAACGSRRDLADFALADSSVSLDVTENGSFCHVPCAYDSLLGLLYFSVSAELFLGDPGWNYAETDVCHPADAAEWSAGSGRKCNLCTGTDAEQFGFYGNSFEPGVVCIFVVDEQKDI